LRISSSALPKKDNKKIGDCWSAFERRAADAIVTNIVFDTKKVSKKFLLSGGGRLAFMCDNTYIQ
jgi:hypothetical protein